MSELNLYDEEAAIGHVKTLEFKRLAGTKGETKAINYIQRELKKKNIDPILESFTWAPTSSIMMKLAFIFILCYTILYELILLFPVLVWIILILDVILVVIIFFGIKMLFDFTKITYIGKKGESKNIIVTIPAKDLYPKRPVIFFTAHYDSISLKYSMTIVKILYGFAGILTLVYLFLTFILGIWSFFAIWTIFEINDIFMLISSVTFIIGIMIIILIIVILFNKRENNSTGSIDNATGTAILIELAKLIKETPLDKTDVIFLWCGAEERGLWGSRMYLNKYFEELDYDYNLDKSYNINIDMVGTYIGLVDKTGIIKKKPLNENLNDVLDAAAKQQKIPLVKSYIPIGAGSDHMSFKAFAKKAEKKLQVTCFLASKDSKYIHSPNDTADKCSAKNLNGVIDICFNTIRSLDLRVDDLEKIR